MPLTPRDIADIERAHAEGLSSKQIITLLADHGEHLTEATLRKYVQLGLLPRSRRVGQKGKHRGSRGIYPIEVVRRLHELRRAMTSGDTLESLARATHAVRAKLASARVSVTEVLEAAETDVEARELDRTKKGALKSELAVLSKQAHAWLRAMDRWGAALQEADAKARPDARAKDAAPKGEPAKGNGKGARTTGRGRAEGRLGAGVEQRARRAGGL
ncbi:MerR family transcriptional regulator [Myxococcota bacterium]|nr:MerR family transcriptional regulator [Myxococcota bacterium]